MFVSLCADVDRSQPAPLVPPDIKKSSAAKTVITLPPEKAAPVRIPRFDRPPVIDGRIDDDVWRQAAVLKNFYQINPGENIAPSKETEVMIGYDARSIYFAFHAFDEPSKVRATLPKRDNIWDDDYVGMFLDTFDDKRRAYALFFSALGVQADGIMTEDNGGNEDYSLDIVMDSRGAVTGDGYVVEIAIPFKSLRYEAGKGKLWGAHFFRRIKRFNNELSSWMPVSRDKSGILNQSGHLTGLENIATERTIEVIPSLTLSETGKRMRTLPASALESDPTLVDHGRFLNRPLEADPGLTAKFVISPAMTLDFALNPDFAQVEADQTVVTANQRFPIFFEEKRPFFLEGVDIFQTPLTVLHTRAIVDPDAAVKLTGKRGRNTFGLMLATDNAPGNFSEEERSDPETLPDIQKFLDKNAYIGVLRLKHDIGRESSFGLIATSYNFIEKHNHVAGFDGRLKLNQKTVFSFQAVGVTSRRLFFDADQDRENYRTGNALGYFWSLDYTTRHFGYFLGGEGRTRDYRADVGFTRRTNTNNNFLFMRYNRDPRPKAKLVSWRLIGIAETNYDWQGRLQRFDVQPRINLQLRKETYLTVGYRRGYERLFEEEFGARRAPGRAGAFFGEAQRATRKHSLLMFFESRPNKRLSANSYIVYETGAFDFDFGAEPRFPRVSPAAIAFPDAPLDPGPGNLWDINAGLVYQPTAALRASLDYTKSRLVRHDTRRVAYDDNIFSLRATYQFTRFVFVRARIDYITLSANARGQFLFGWTPSPGTAFYAGYNDDINRNGFNPFTNQLEPGLRRNGRTFFIKLSYLIRRSIGG
jgi:hypothetical protein